MPAPTPDEQTPLHAALRPGGAHVRRARHAAPEAEQPFAAPQEYVAQTMPQLAQGYPAREPILSVMQDYAPPKPAVAPTHASVPQASTLSQPAKRRRPLPIVQDWDPALFGLPDLSEPRAPSHPRSPLPVLQDWQPEPPPSVLPEARPVQAPPVPRSQTLAALVQGSTAGEPRVSAPVLSASNPGLPVLHDWETPHAGVLPAQSASDAAAAQLPAAQLPAPHPAAASVARQQAAPVPLSDFPAPVAAGGHAPRAKSPTREETHSRAAQVWLQLRRRKYSGTMRVRRAPWGRIAIFAAAIVGVAVMLYPSAGTWLSAYAQSSTVSGYATTVAEAPTAEKQALITVARDYNANLPHGQLRDPYSSTASVAANEAVAADYRKQLTLPGTDVMSRVTIPKIHVDLPVYHGTDDSSIGRGVGHLLGSSLPVGGAGTHAVLAAHSGLPDATMFTDLSKLKLGDTFTVTTMDEPLWYKVDQIKVVTPDDLSDLTIVDGKDYVTLVTCTPIHINSHRLLVRGERIAAPADAVQQIAAPGAGFPWWACIFLGAVAVLVLVLFAPRKWFSWLAPRRRVGPRRQASPAPPPAGHIMTDVGGRSQPASVGQHSPLRRSFW